MLHMKCFIFLLFFLPLLAESATTYGNVQVSEIRSIYDGDTFRVDIEDWPAIIGEHVSVRVGGADTPEMRGKCQKEKELARQAKKFTAAKLRKANVVELRSIKRGKYFRIVADVYVDGVSLARQLIESNLAVPYDGGIKSNWCKRSVYEQ